ncbi:MAG: UvrD-helicase domain-containing protein [Planctomycetia bacterium]|nr:UvrD-helicase domain-containing protein [Planctomycetia bacterium]
MWSDLLDSLTPAQREAVEHLEGPLLILAGPGSGKTRVITHRIANLLRHGVPARAILALTFTNKAADEMRARLERLAPGEPVWMSTFHRFCSRLLRQYGPLVGLRENFTIYDSSDSRNVLRRTLDELHIDAVLYPPERIASAISWAKNNLITAEHYQARPGHPLGSVVAKVYPAYQARLLASSAVDFDDLLLHVASMLRESPETRSALDARYRYILVDEYQDTNLAQYTIARALSIDVPNLAVTGDPDQSIYGWRGANLRNILDFEQDYPAVRVVKLERNYRSTKRILRVADTLISYNQRRKKKGLYTENDEGQSVGLLAYATQRAEAESISAYIAEGIRAGRRRPRDFAIFYRVNALSRSLEFALREEGIPYQMVNGLEFYQRREIKDVLSYLHLINNPRDDNAFLRVINTPPRGIGKSTIGRLAEHAARYQHSLLDAARESGLIESLNKRAAVAVAKFVSLYDRLSLMAAAPVEEVLGHVLSESGYQQFLRESEDEEDQERLANIEELLTAARQFDENNPGEGRLETFLEEACLVNETDAWQADDDRVTLMTLHASKGLEFPVVFIVALEEGLLPHERSREHNELLEEERRLLFVGITRAREELQLSLATYREFRGQRRRTVPSQFLMELPRGEMRVVEPSWNDPAWVTEDEMPWEADAPETASEPEIKLPVASGPISTTPLTTAAKLHGTETAELPHTSPDAFHQGMVVRHPEYGLGKVVALSGSGAKRSATIAFASLAGQKKFMLAQSQLRPAKSL